MATSRPTKQTSHWHIDQRRLQRGRLFLCHLTRDLRKVFPYVVDILNDREYRKSATGEFSMTTNTLETSHASAERTEREEILEQHELLQSKSAITMVLDAMPLAVALLDKNRQIIMVNENIRQAFVSGDIEQILGLRLGDLLSCQHSFETAGGCGTTEACRTCGAGNAVLSALEGIPMTSACQITTDNPNESLDLSVTAKSMPIDGQEFVIVSVQDMADENRRNVLERTFFHDVLNAAGGASGIANLLAESDTMDDVKEFAPLLVSVTEQLISEIHAQRDLLAAERGDLTVKKEGFSTGQIIKEVLQVYNKHQVAETRHLVLDPAHCDEPVHTSKTLLHRVLGNMVKNALEATAAGGTVTLGCDQTHNDVCFWVNNAEVMPDAIQLQVFGRSFSTKGAGRGIGTYSIRLLGEKYLGGRVSFTSLAGQGTTFRIHLPRTPRDTPDAGKSLNRYAIPQGDDSTPC